MRKNEKKSMWKKFIANGMALAMTVSLVPQAFAADSDAEGWVSWLPVVQQDGDAFYPPMQAESGKENQVEFSFVNDPIHSSDQNGAIKAERFASGGIQLKLDRESNIGAAILPKRENEVVVAASVNVWADEDAAGSTLASYAFFEGTDYIEDGAHFNGAFNNKGVKTLEQGWNTLYFDITQCKYLGFLFWQSTSSAGTIYLDDFKLKYVSVDDPMDSFDYFESDWEVGDASAFTLTQNTDPQYVKHGTGSIKVESKSNADTYLLRTKLFNNGDINGKLIPQFKGYTPKNIGFWVYIVEGANVLIGGAGSDRKIRVNKPGWNYVNYDLFTEHTNSYYRNDFKKITQFTMRCDSPAGSVIYLDGLTVEYEKQDETVAERFENDSTFFGKNGNFVCYDYRELQDNGKYVKEGFTSARLTVIPAQAKYPNNEVPTNNWRNGGMALPADKNGNMPIKLGMWVYGNGKNNVKIGLDSRNALSSSTEANISDPILIDWEGWKQVWFDLPEGTKAIYGIRYGRDTEGDQEVIYVDKMTCEYPVVEEPVNRLVNGTETLDMSAVKLNDTIEYQLDFVKDGFADKDMWVMVAAYDASGKLIAVNKEDVRSDAAGKIQGNVSITVDAEEKLQQMATVKGFCWDASELVPACDAVTATK